MILVEVSGKQQTGELRMTFRLSCAQFQSRPGDVDYNLGKMENICGEAAQGGADLVLFAELIVTAYGGRKVITQNAQPIDGPVVERVRNMARGHSLDIAFGFPERNKTTGALHNAMAYISSKGDVEGQYHKVHLWDTERTWATPGGVPLPFNTRFGPMGMWICYDTRFPELARMLAVDGAELALVSTAWLGPGDEWEVSMRSRALDNGIFVAGADQISRARGAQCAGRSMIVNPHGHVLARAEEWEEGVITADIDLSVVASFHERVPLLEHRAWRLEDVAGEAAQDTA